MVGFGETLTRPFCFLFGIIYMKRKPFFTLILIIIALMALALGGWYFFAKKPQLVEVGNTSEETLRISAFEGSIKPIYEDPILVRIPSINLVSELEEVSVTKGGILGTPESWNTIGWYRKSSKPGEAGNLILVGHYDDNLGRPAIFWGLKNLKVNDTVYVSDTFGRVYSYRVTDVFYVDLTDSDRLSVLESDDSASITLITCGGVWVPSKATYSKRLVVRGVI